MEGTLAKSPISFTTPSYTKVDDGPHTMNYSQTFQLMPEGDSFYVFNDVFRLVYVRRPLPPKSHTESWVGKLV